MLHWIVWNRTVCVIKWLMFNWIVKDTKQHLEPINFVDILNWIVSNRTVLTFNGVKTKKKKTYLNKWLCVNKKKQTVLC